ncbi:MAG: hypothetical protein WB392_04870 [Methanotrichaceae archaeon]
MKGDTKMTKLHMSWNNCGTDFPCDECGEWFDFDVGLCIESESNNMVCDLCAAKSNPELFVKMVRVKIAGFKAEEKYLETMKASKKLSEIAEAIALNNRKNCIA